MNCFRNFIYLIVCSCWFSAIKVLEQREVHYDTIQQQQKTDTVQKIMVVKRNKVSCFLWLKNKNKDFNTLGEKYSQEELHDILAINRLDYKNRWRADKSLVVPDVLEKDFTVYSPFLKTFLRLKHSEVGDIQLCHSCLCL